MKYLLLLLSCFCLFACKNEKSIPATTKKIATKTTTQTKFNVWAASDPHVTVDALHGVEPLQLALRQSEGYWNFLPKMEVRLGGIPPAFDWDVLLLAGDFTSSQFPPRDGEGKIFVRQFEVMEKHRREDVYSIAGNHDGDYYDLGAGEWFQKWVDPLGENMEFSGVDNSKRRFPPKGNWERYKFETGNILYLMLSDYNSAPTPVGRGTSAQNLPGGFPAGAVTRETFNWWKEQVIANQDKIIITVHHHVLRGTTTISFPNGGKGIHANNTGDFEGASYLYYIVENTDPENFEYTMSTESTPGPFEQFLEEFQKENGKAAIDVWIGAHSHAHPQDTYNNKGLVEDKWGVTFMQVSALTHYHSGRTPMSWLLSFTDESDQLAIGNYVHRAPYYNHIPAALMKSKGVKAVGKEAPEGGLTKNGWYEPNAKKIKLRHSFSGVGIPAPF